MKASFRKPLISILLTILFLVWVSAIFYHYYPRLWPALRHPLAAAKTISPRYMNLGVVGIGLLVLAALVIHFGLAYLLSLGLNAKRKRVVCLILVVLVLGLAWSFYRYPSLLDAGVNLALLLMILVISALAGRKFLHVLGSRADSPLEEFVFSVGLGLGLFTYAILALALLGLLHAWLVWLLLIGLGIALFKDIWRGIKSIGKHFSGLFAGGCSVKNRAADILLVSLVSIYALVNLVGALAPEIETDALVHHLYIPKVYIQNHGLVYVPYHTASAYPLGMEMLFTLGMLLGNSTLAKLIHFSLGLLSMLATYCLGRKYVDSRAGLLAAVIFYTIPVVAWESTTAYIDLGLTFFTVLEIFALVNWWRAQREGWLAVAAILCGFAMGTKYLGIFALVILIIGIFLKLSFTDKRDVSAVLRAVLVYASVSALVVSPWLIKNYVFTRNPVYPFLNNLFKSPLMPPINPTFDWASFGMGDNVFSRYLLTPWNMTFYGTKYGGTIGPVFLIFIPLVFVLRTDKILKFMLLFYAVYFALWEISVPVMRYLIPVMPLLSIVIGHTIHRMICWDNVGSKILSVGVTAVAGVTLFLGLPFFHPLWQQGWIPGVIQHVPYEVVLGIESREDYLSRYLGSYDVFQYINRNLPSDAKVFCFNEEFHYLSDRTLVPAFSFEAVNVVSSSSESELLTHLDNLGVTHFLVNWGFVADPQRSLAMLQDGFVSKHLDPLYGQGSVALYELSLEPLPPQNYVWQEGESFLAQSGAGGVDFKTPASNDQCLGMGWGGSKGDVVEYEVAIPLDLPSAVLLIRYAREGQTDAAINVRLDEQLVGVSPSVSLSPTDGWGYADDEWAYQELSLGPVGAGEHKVGFISQLDGGTVNIDGFFIADSSFQPPDDVHYILR